MHIDGFPVEFNLSTLSSVLHIIHLFPSYITLHFLSC